MVKMFSGGRPRAALLLVWTIGRSIRMGLSCMACMSWVSVKFGFSRLFSL